MKKTNREELIDIQFELDALAQRLEAIEYPGVTMDIEFAIKKIESLLSHPDSIVNASLNVNRGTK